MQEPPSFAEETSGDVAPETTSSWTLGFHVLSLLLTAHIPSCAAIAEENTPGTPPVKQAAVVDKPIPEPNVYDSDIQDARPAPAVSPPSEESPSTESEDNASAETSTIFPRRQKWMEPQDHWGVDGLHFKGKYNVLRLVLGGRVAAGAGILRQDHALEDAYPNFDDNIAMLRSAQLQITGNFGPHIFLKAQYEAAKYAGVKDLYVVFQDIPYVSNLRVGHAKEPFSLERPEQF